MELIYFRFQGNRMLSWSRQLSSYRGSSVANQPSDRGRQSLKTLAIDFKPGNLNDLHTSIPLLRVERPITKWRKPLPWN
jgi:hypothetical protein